jgi:hypothetical protein
VESPGAAVFSSYLVPVASGRFAEVPDLHTRYGAATLPEASALRSVPIFIWQR